MKSVFITLFTILVLATSQVLSQETVVPVDLQYALFMKIMSFNRTFADSENRPCVIGIAYQSLFARSRNTKDEFLKVMEGFPVKDIKGRHIECVPIDVIGQELPEVLRSKHIDVLYVTPLRAYDLGSIIDACRNGKILSITGVPAYSEMGLSVSIGQKGDKPEIIINIEAAKSEGADFSSQLLKLATIIREPKI